MAQGVGLNRIQEYIRIDDVAYAIGIHGEKGVTPPPRKSSVDSRARSHREERIREG